MRNHQIGSIATIRRGLAESTCIWEKSRDWIEVGLVVGPREGRPGISRRPGRGPRRRSRRPARRRRTGRTTSGPLPDRRARSSLSVGGRRWRLTSRYRRRDRSGRRNHRPGRPRPGLAQMRRLPATERPPAGSRWVRQSAESPTAVGSRETRCHRRRSIPPTGSGRLEGEGF